HHSLRPVDAPCGKESRRQAPEPCACRADHSHRPAIHGCAALGVCIRGGAAPFWRSSTTNVEEVIRRRDPFGERRTGDGAALFVLSSIGAFNSRFVGAASEPSLLWFNGAAQESNLPSVGLRRRTGFEDQLGHRPQPLREPLCQEPPRFTTARNRSRTLPR